MFSFSFFILSNCFCFRLVWWNFSLCFLLMFRFGFQSVCMRTYSFLRYEAYKISSGIVLLRMSKIRVHLILIDIKKAISN